MFTKKTLKPLLFLGLVLFALPALACVNPSEPAPGSNEPPAEVQPQDLTRLVVVSGNIDIVDDEIFSDEHHNVVFNEQANVNGNQPAVVVETEGCAGDEVRVELIVNAALSGNAGDVQISGEAHLYEGTDCATNDLEDTEEFSFIVGAGQSLNRTINLQNAGAGGGDTAEIALTVANNTP